MRADASGLALLALVILLYGGAAWIVRIRRKARLYDELKPRLDTLVRGELALTAERAAFARQSDEDHRAIAVLAEQKSKGFPWLAKAYADYFHLQDQQLAKALTRDFPSRET
jgi:hypothetical protein